MTNSIRRPLKRVLQKDDTPEKIRQMNQSEADSVRIASIAGPELIQQGMQPMPILNLASTAPVGIAGPELIQQGMQLSSVSS